MEQQKPNPSKLDGCPTQSKRHSSAAEVARSNSVSVWRRSEIQLLNDIGWSLWARFAQKMIVSRLLEPPCHRVPDFLRHDESAGSYVLQYVCLPSTKMTRLQI